MQLTCSICKGPSFLLDAVDFNKSCEEPRGFHLPPSGIPVSYFLCERCGFCFAPEFSRWTAQDFANMIYNSGYAQVDPDYVEARPRENAKNLIALLGARGKEIRHLDYGGGEGLLSKLLRAAGWQSTSYDPFVDGDKHVEELGQFDLITCYEVFEHVPEVRTFLRRLSSLLARDGIGLFTTLLSDGNIRRGEPLKWWYASPRNGHISLFSRKSLQLLCNQEGYRFGSFSAGFHAFCKDIPQWASHFIHG